MSKQIESSVGCSTGLSPQVSVLIIYLFHILGGGISLGWVSGLVFLLIEKQNHSVRFHAMQSLLLNIALLAVSIVVTVLAFIPIVGVIIAMAMWLVGLAALVLIILIIVKKFQGKDLRLPIIADMADRLLSTL